MAKFAHGAKEQGFTSMTCNPMSASVLDNLHHRTLRQLTGKRSFKRGDDDGQQTSIISALLLSGA
jgi:hypothetical protein